MKVSVIIPTRNRFRLLVTRSFPSVISQTFQDFEMIVINDASEDHYAVPLTRSPRVRYIKNKQRMGLAYNRNLGAELAHGEGLVFLDDDNELRPDFLLKTVEFLARHPQCMAVGVGKVIVYPEGEVYQGPPAVKGFFPMNDCFLIRREAFLQVRCDEEMLANEDADFGLRFQKEFQVGWVNEPHAIVKGSAANNRTSYTN